MSVTTFFKTLCDNLGRRHRQKAAIRHLESLDDCHLRDVGIERAEIETVVNGRPARGDIARSFRHEWQLLNLMTIIHPLWLAHPPRERGRW